MVWGFGKSEDEYYQQPQQESSMFDTLWSGIKFVAKAAFYAALAIVTLGTIFTMSSGAKDFADKYAFGMGSKIKGWMDGGIDTVKNFLSPSDSNTSVSSTKTEKIGDVTVLRPNTELSESEINKNPTAFKQLANINGAREQAEAAMVSKEEGDRRKAELNDQRKQAMAYIKHVSEWNNAVISKTPDDKEKEQQKQTGIAAPQAPIINLDIPDAGENKVLNAAGLKAYGPQWKSAGKLEKFQMLSKITGLSSDPMERPKDLLPPSHVNIPTLRDASDVNGVYLLRDGTIKGPTLDKPLTFDKVLSNDNPNKTAKVANEAISSLIQEGRLPEATLVANTIIERLEIYGSKLPNKEKRLGADFKKAIESLKTTRDYVTNLEQRLEYDGYSDKTFAAVINAAAVAPQQIQKYESEVTIYREKVKTALREKAEAPATDPEALKKAIENGTTNKETDLKATIPNNGPATGQSAAPGR